MTVYDDELKCALIRLLNAVASYRRLEARQLPNNNLVQLKSDICVLRDTFEHLLSAWLKENGIEDEE